MTTFDFKAKNWRDYQKKLRRHKKRRVILQKLPLTGTIIGCVFLFTISFFWAGSWIFANLRTEKKPGIEGYTKDPLPPSYTKEDLPDLLSGFKLEVSPVTGDYIIDCDGSGLTISTSLDTALQNYIKRMLERSMTYEAAAIVMRPDTGQILAMVNSGKQKESNGLDLCLNTELPAASLFKIVSAAAAIEARDFLPNRPLNFRGGKYTLYKSQLKEGSGKYYTKTNFVEAFSESINPVFGKIGIYDLGKELLDQYAKKFYFNRRIPFDLPLNTSHIQVPEDSFGLAEIASGFNKRTLLSPLHAVMITSTVANNGVMMEPWIVNDIRDEVDRILYRKEFSQLTNPIQTQTAQYLRTLMVETVVHGTCSKTFRTLRRKAALKDIELGAKSGTINDYSDTYKYDWLTAYAIPKNNDNRSGISLVVLAVHGEKLGRRAKDIARDIINFRFKS